MEPARARPAVGTAKDRTRPVGAVDPPQLAGDEVERARPVDRHEPVIATPDVATETVFQPATPNMRLRDARRIARRAQHIAEDRAGVGIAAPPPQHRSIRAAGYLRNPQ